MITLIKRALGMSPDGDYIGSIVYWAGPKQRIPVNYAICAGQRIQIRDNPALYSVIGPAWGGDGKEYFNLPNLTKEVPEQIVPLICVKGWYPQFE